MIVGTLISFGTWLLYKQGVLSFRSDLAETQWGAIIGFAAGLIAIVIATRFDTPKPLSELNGLVLGLQERDVQTTARVAWYKSPVLLGAGALVLCGLLYLYIGVV
jgi:SSS family solute:Na+ symporter